MSHESQDLKSLVRAHWQNETCGTRYGLSTSRKKYFDAISGARYYLEPHIMDFASFPAARGLKVLEIGVGAGSDFQNFVKHGAIATGVDLTVKAIALTAERLALNGHASAAYELHPADAENLPFHDNRFDMVYSWGVLHHTPDTEKAFKETFRVLKPGGIIKAMVYHVNSWTCWMLWIRFGLLRARPLLSIRRVVFDHLESPGTTVYSLAELRHMLDRIGYVDFECEKKLSPGDLLKIKPSAKFRHPIYRIIWTLYPRWLVSLIGHRFGLHLCISARKPEL
jgi:SAM-dependent methyltransferase